MDLVDFAFLQGARTPHESMCISRLFRRLDLVDLRTDGLTAETIFDCCPGAKAKPGAGARVRWVGPTYPGPQGPLFVDVEPATGLFGERAQLLQMQYRG